LAEANGRASVAKDMAVRCLVHQIEKPVHRSTQPEAKGNQYRRGADPCCPEDGGEYEEQVDGYETRR
jgi:hypothetical protein